MFLTTKNKYLGLGLVYLKGLAEWKDTDQGELNTRLTARNREKHVLVQQSTFTHCTSTELYLYCTSTELYLYCTSTALYCPVKANRSNFKKIKIEL